MTKRRNDGGIGWIFHSLAGRLALLAVVFLAVPILIFDHFRRADDATHALLLASAQRQGQLIARALEPELARSNRAALSRMGELLARFADEHTRLRLLLRPNPPIGDDGFFYVGAVPAVPAADLDNERERLLEEGVLDHLGASCAGRTPLALRVGRSGGGEEILTSITPVETSAGCWALVTSSGTAALVGSSLGRPYWQTPTVQAAAVVYGGMALLVLGVLTGLWRTVQRFRDTARAIADGDSDAGGFAERNRVPELAGVAEEFDGLVATLRQSALALRRAAEDNAHAFKTPIAVIRQATEPVRRSLAVDDARSHRALALIDASLDKLDGLVGYARRMDETAADLLAPSRRRVDLSALLERLAVGYTGVLAERQCRIDTRIAPGIIVRANTEILETVIENLVENAISFSPPGGVVTVALSIAQDAVSLTVEDEGPGVDPALIPRLFERYFSCRAPGRGLPADADAPAESHFGIGLWIVRRNVEAVGGRVEAENRDGSPGFRVRVALPAAG